MISKLRDTSNYWIANKEEWEKFLAKENIFSFEDYDSIKKFEGTHPAVMQPRILQQNYQLNLDVNKKKLKLKHRVMYFIEKLTGKRFFEFKNYRVIR